MKQCFKEGVLTGFTLGYGNGQHTISAYTRRVAYINPPNFTATTHQNTYSFDLRQHIALQFFNQNVPQDIIMEVSFRGEDGILREENGEWSSLSFNITWGTNYKSYNGTFRQGCYRSRDMSYVKYDYLRYTPDGNNLSVPFNININSATQVNAEDFFHIKIGLLSQVVTLE